MVGDWTSQPGFALSEAPSDSGGHSSSPDSPDSQRFYPPTPVGTGKTPVPVELRDVTGRFKLGYTGGGRPKGSRNKLKEAVLATVLDHYNAKGKSVLDSLAETDPASYMRIILILLPSDNTSRDDYGDLTEEEVKELLASVYRARKVRELIHTVEGG